MAIDHEPNESSTTPPPGRHGVLWPLLCGLASFTCALALLIIAADPAYGHARSWLGLTGVTVSILGGGLTGQMLKPYLEERHGSAKSGRLLH